MRVAMKDISIYFSEDTEVSEYEAINKGYRIDVYVKVRENIFNVSVYTLTRLQQDFQHECEEYGYYHGEPNLILVREANRNEIICTINVLFRQKYFERIMPLECLNVSEMVEVQ